MAGDEEKAPATKAEEVVNEDEGEEVNKEEEDTGANIAPIVKLEEVAVSTGEEDETALIELKARLYRFDKKDNMWKERGTGPVKLLEHKETKKIRLVLRQQKTLKICANHTVSPSTTLQEHGGSDKSWVWHASDFADGELKEELFTIRFGSVESAQKFKEVFEESQEKMAKLLGSDNPEQAKEADAVAELFEKKLEVKDEVEEKKAEA